MTTDDQEMAAKVGAKALVELIRDLADPDPCWFDHHGYCQAHGWTKTEPTCAHGRAQALLAKYDGGTS